MQFLQAPATHTLPLAQSPLAGRGATTQAPVRQVKGVHATGAPAMHRAPLPGQVLATRLSPWQVFPQLVPAAATVHVPLPSQVPLLPQTGLAGSMGQPPPGGALPMPTSVQVPVP